MAGFGMTNAVGARMMPMSAGVGNAVLLVSNLDEQVSGA